MLKNFENAESKLFLLSFLYNIVLTQYFSCLNFLFKAIIRLLLESSNNNSARVSTKLPSIKNTTFSDLNPSTNSL